MAMQILVVDADSAAAAATRDFAQHLVPSAYISCETTPERAWHVAQRTPPGLLLLDPAPYTPSGLLLIQLCKASWPEMRVIVLTSAPLAPSRIRQCHADAYLEKPASPARLLDALNGVLHDAKGVPGPYNTVQA